VGLIGCTPGGFQKSQLLPGQLDSGIFSNRPQMQNKSIVLIQFQNPPLLSSVQMVNGKKAVDPDLKKAITEEQSVAEAKLKALSSEIVILYRYKMVLNAFAVITPNSLKEQLKAIGGVAYVEGEGSFARPRVMDVAQGASGTDMMSANSVKFIGADVVHQMKVKDKDGNDVALDGTGMRVGVIDTGIDYTHAMLGGAGTAAAYKAVNPSAANLSFPTAKVIGGIDLAGTTYNSASANLNDRLPVPDANPLDEFGHGSHVAGTIAGKGDGVNTYDGVAPGAKLYAIKVFGADGSTGDAVVIAGLEYAADPTGLGDPTQTLDAVNLSLGGPYGSSHILYQQAIRNLSGAGTVVLCAAGNEGASDYIVGAPSVTDEAFSVAASIDDAIQNWQFPAVKITYAGGDLLSESMESPLGTPLDKVGSLSGPMVYVGIADKDFDDATKAKVNGKVALIDRGVVTFADKISRAQAAGAVAVVVANNIAGDPFKMGGGKEGSFKIPAIMVSQSVGDLIKSKLPAGDVVIQFNTPEKIIKKEVIDTITDFSSKGPRSQDSAIKPEISAPGQNVISVNMGSGNLGTQMSGTSMATPHMTGVMTILKQEHPELSPDELKSLAMSTAKIISDSKGAEYPVSYQGAGRIQLDKAVLAEAVTVPASVSLGAQNISNKKIVAAQITVKNISKRKITFMPSFQPRVGGINLSSANALTLAAGDSGIMDLRFALDASVSKDATVELDGFLTLKTGGTLDMTLPVLAVIKRISNIQSEQFSIHSTSATDSAGAAADVYVKNSGTNAGDVMVFNLLGRAPRKLNPGSSDSVETSCNLQAAGYRIIKKPMDGGGTRMFLEVAAKLYQAEDTWNMCEISVLIDKDGKGVPSQELAGVALGNVPGLSDAASAGQFASVLFDAVAVRNLRMKYEVAMQQPLAPGATAPTESYLPAVLDRNEMMNINHSTVAVVEVPVDELGTTESGALSIRVATISDNDSVQTDDFLEKSLSQWTRISVQESSQAFMGMPEKTTVNAGQEAVIPLVKGVGDQDLLLLYPQNANVSSDVIEDQQSQTPTPGFD